MERSARVGAGGGVPAAALVARPAAAAAAAAAAVPPVPPVLPALPVLPDPAGGASGRLDVAAGAGVPGRLGSGVGVLGRLGGGGGVGAAAGGRGWSGALGGAVAVVAWKVSAERPIWIRSLSVRAVGAARRRPLRAVPLRDSSTRVHVVPERFSRAWIREIWSSDGSLMSAFEPRPMVNVSLSAGSVQRCEPSDTANSDSNEHSTRQPTRRRDSAFPTRTWSRAPRPHEPRHTRSHPYGDPERPPYECAGQAP